jgi:hypothetical protein
MSPKEGLAPDADEAAMDITRYAAILFAVAA